MNFLIFKMTFKKALSTPNDYDSTMCMNQLMIEINKSNETLILNILKGCFNTLLAAGENLKKMRALMVDFFDEMLDRGLQTKNKIFMVNIFKSGLFDHLVGLASFEKANPNPRRGEALFNDTDPVERRVAGDFYIQLRETLSDWNKKFGVDKNGKVTKFRLGYQVAFEGAADAGTVG